MKFKEGKIIDRFYVKTGELITIRFPRKSDTRGLRKYINSLVEEKSRILLNKKQSSKQEEKWLGGLIKENKGNKNISLVIEADGKVIGLDELRRNEGSKYHTATYSAGVMKKYRNLGITKRVFKIVEKIAYKNGIKIIQSSYFSDNHPSAKLHKKLGFKVCGRIPKAAKFGNKYLDEVILYKTVEKWKHK